LFLSVARSQIKLVLLGRRHRRLCRTGTAHLPPISQFLALALTRKIGLGSEPWIFFSITFSSPYPDPKATSDQNQRPIVRSMHLQPTQCRSTY
jgi:hypothetical protein